MELTGGGCGGGDVREGGGQGSHRESHPCLLSLPLKEVSPSPLMCYLASCIFPESFTVRFDKARAFSNFQCWQIKMTHFKLQPTWKLHSLHRQWPLLKLTCPLHTSAYFQNLVQIHIIVIVAYRKQKDFFLEERSCNCSLFFQNYICVCSSRFLSKSLSHLPKHKTQNWNLLFFLLGDWHSHITFHNNVFKGHI